MTVTKARASGPFAFPKPNSSLPPSLLLAAFAAQIDSGLSRLSLVGTLMSLSKWPTESRHARGYGSAWDKLRLHVLQRDNGLCKCSHCAVAGRVTSATECDHIISKAKGKALGWTNEQIDDPSNLQAINTDCHKRKTVEENGGKPKQRIGLDGWAI